MSKHQKLLLKILRGTSDAHIPFEGLRSILLQLFTREDIEEILNLQTKGSQAKPYQVRQVRQALVKYQLGGSEDAEV